MKLEEQVASLDLCKKLKSLLIKQKSLFYWCQCLGEYNPSPKYYAIVGMYTGNLGHKDSPTYSAFTISELGEILPNTVRIDGSEPFDNYRIYTTKFYSVTYDMKKINNFVVNYECDTSELDGFGRRKLTKNFYDPNEANARAMMLIYLIENKIMETI